MDKTNRWVVAALAVLGVSAAACAWGDSPGTTVQELITEKLADAPGKELTMITVEYPPGGSSQPHRHDAYVLVYVLEGTLEMQVAGGPLQTLKAGGTFLERPNDVHVVSRNASRTVPAKFLVVMLKGTDNPASRSVPPRPQGH